MKQEPIIRGIYVCCDKFADYSPCDHSEVLGTRFIYDSGRVVEVFNSGAVKITEPAVGHSYIRNGQIVDDFT